MYIYILALLITLMFSFLSTKINNKELKKIFQIFSMLPLFVVSAIRYNVGTDYHHRYVVAFNIIAGGEDVPSLEILFKFIIKICLLIANNSDLLFIVTSIFTVPLLFKVIYEESERPCLSIFVYFCLGFYFQSLNIVRQYVSISILLSGYFLYKKDKKIIGFVLAILAVLVHNVSIIGLSYFVIDRISKKQKEIKVVKLFVILIIIVVFHNYITQVFATIMKLTRFYGYIGGIFDYSQFNIVSFVINLLTLALMYYFQKRNNFKEEKAKFYIYMQMLTLIFISLSSVFSLFARLVCYFSFFQIFSIPFFLNNIKKNKNFSVMYLIFLLILCFNIYNTNILHNYGEVLPYQTIFDR